MMSPPTDDDINEAARLEAARQQAKRREDDARKHETEAARQSAEAHAEVLHARRVAEKAVAAGTGSRSEVRGLIFRRTVTTFPDDFEWGAEGLGSHGKLRGIAFNAREGISRVAFGGDTPRKTVVGWMTDNSIEYAHESDEHYAARHARLAGRLRELLVAFLAHHDLRL